MRFSVTIIAVLFAFTFCTAGCSRVEGTIQSGQNDTIYTSTTKMKITIGTTVFTATLYSSPSADAFKRLLPLTIKMSELNGNEKYYDFPDSLPTKASVGGKVKVGDLMLYGNNTLVLFYASFNTKYNYTKLGHIDDPAGLLAALGMEMYW